MDPRLLDELARQLADAVPADFARLREDLQRNFRTLLDDMFSRLDLVTREEFDAQRAVLARTREKLEALEAQLQQLENAR